MRTYLDFEKPISDLEGKIEELRHLSGENTVNIVDEVAKLEAKLEKMMVQTYSKLTPWQKIQVARHQDRPHTLDYIDKLVDDFCNLAGDRVFAEDPAIIGGLGRFRGRSVVVIGHEKGSDTESRLRHNFGMARPEGYRKSQRLMELANKFNLPVITLIDTPGAYPGMDAEERGQAEAIARSIEHCLSLQVPLISVIIGEGGSGGAIALASANQVVMLEHSIYTVISPEGCASILWRDSEKAADAADALHLTAQDLFQFKIIDEIIREPVGGAQRAPGQTIESVADVLENILREFDNLDGNTIQNARRQKFLEIGDPSSQG